MDMKGRVLAAALRGMAAVRLPVLFRRRARQGGILSFHRLYEPTPRELAPQSLSVSPDHFRGLVKGLLADGYLFLTIGDLVRRLS